MEAPGQLPSLPPSSLNPVLRRVHCEAERACELISRRELRRTARLADEAAAGATDRAVTDRPNVASAVTCVSVVGQLVADLVEKPSARDVGQWRRQDFVRERGK